MVVIDFWIQKHLLPVIGENSLEKSNSIKLACWFSIESNGITQSGENLLQSMAMLNSKNAIWRGVGSLIFRNIVTKNMSSDLFKSLRRQNICTEFTEIGGSGHENKNQNKKPMFIKKCCWHRVIGSKAKCNNPLTWWGLWWGLSIGL